MSLDPLLRPRSIAVIGASDNPARIGGVPVDLTPGVLQSPVRFAGYAAAAMFATLPPVVAPDVTQPEKKGSIFRIVHR